VRDIENLSLEEGIKRFQDEKKSLRNQAVILRKQKVGYKIFNILVQYTGINLPRDFLLMKGTTYMY